MHYGHFCGRLPLTEVSFRCITADDYALALGDVLEFGLEHLSSRMLHCISSDGQYACGISNSALTLGMIHGDWG